MDWLSQAKCGAMPPGMFDPMTAEERTGFGLNVMMLPRVRAAVWVCNRLCPVLEQCRNEPAYLRIQGVTGGRYLSREGARVA